MNHPHPETGGAFVRDPLTGELKPDTSEPVAGEPVVPNHEAGGAYRMVDGERISEAEYRRRRAAAAPPPEPATTPEPEGPPSAGLSVSARRKRRALTTDNTPE
jgi:hypothetical protein